MIRDLSEKEVGWFVLSLGQSFLYLFDAKTLPWNRLAYSSQFAAKMTD